MFLEIGLLIAYDKYDGQAPAAGVITGVGLVEGRPTVIVANDATVKAGAWWPETIPKILRAQEIAMRNRLPIVYLVDSAGINLPYQDSIFPGPIRRGADFLLQLADAAEAESAADRGGDGHVHRGRRVSARALRRHHHGGRHQLHGPGRSESGQGRGGTGRVRRSAGRRFAAHADQRRGALQSQRRSGCARRSSRPNCANCRAAGATRPYQRHRARQTRRRTLRSAARRSSSALQRGRSDRPHR